MNKQYIYDYQEAYNQTVPTNMHEIKVEAQTPPSTPNNPLTQGTPRTSYTPPPAPPLKVQKSNFVPVVGTLLFILIAGTIIYSRLPRTYEDCTRWPGSQISDTIPSTCKTFYGAEFTAGEYQDIQLSDITGSVAQLTTDQPASLAGSLTETNPTPTSTSTVVATTKGGQPLPTSTPKPTTAPDSPSTKLVTHKYPEQHFSIKLPKNYSSTHVTRQIETGVMTFTISSNGATVINARIQPNWDNTDDAKNHGITFMLDDTGVIKVDTSTDTTYYFERSGFVYIFTCAHNGTQTLKDACDAAIKSIQFTN